MKQNNMLAMILAGGCGTRLLELTKKNAKPAVYFGGKYRIIDFPLSNCANSDINVVGVLTQYESVELNAYAGAGQRWGLDARGSGVYVLPPGHQARTAHGDFFHQRLLRRAARTAMHSLAAVCLPIRCRTSA